MSLRVLLSRSQPLVEARKEAYGDFNLTELRPGVIFLEITTANVYARELGSWTGTDRLSICSGTPCPQRLTRLSNEAWDAWADFY